jgi:hypothetical protein
VTSLLLPHTLAALAEVHPRAPFFSNTVQADLFAQRHTRGPYQLLPSAAGGYVVFDTRAPLGRAAVSTHPTEDDGQAALERLAP